MSLLSMFKKPSGNNRAEGQPLQPVSPNPSLRAEPPSFSTPTPPGNVSESLAQRVTDAKLLFAGIDVPRFREIESNFQRLQPTWACLSATEAGQALDTLSSSYFDIVILDGALAADKTLVQKIAERAPRSFRILLSAPQTELAQPLRLKTEFLAPDSDPKVLAENIRRNLRVERWMAEPSVRKLLSMIHRLPTLPKLHAQITEVLRDPSGALEEVSVLVAKDPVMSAKFLQIVNSACFGLSYTVTDPGEAVMFLGLERTRGLVLMAGVFSQFDRVRCSGFSVAQLWDHSLRVGALARGICMLESEDPKLAEAAFTAGLVHEIGNLVLAANLPEMYSTVRRLQPARQIPLSQAELDILGTTSARLGACLLGTWKLPADLLEAVAWHATPEESQDTQFSLVTAVHAANILAQETVRENGIIDQPERFDLAYLARLGLGTRRNCWREGCGLPVGIEQETACERIRRQRDAKNN